MIVLKKTAEKPEAVWVSYGEGVGIGDGKTVVFELPVTKAEANGLQILINGVTIAEDRKHVIETDPDTGKVTQSEADGWNVTESEDQKKVLVTFAKAPRLGARITCSAIGRETPNALGFRIYPTVRIFQEQFEKRHPKITRQLRDVAAKKMKFGDIEDGALLAFFDDIFETLVVDWSGVVDEDGQKVPCTTESKKQFLRLGDNAAMYGFWVSMRSNDVRSYLTGRTEEDLRK